MVNESRYLTPLALLMGLVSGIVIAFLLSSGAFADKCIRCSAYGGDGGDGGDGGKAIAGDVGPGGHVLQQLLAIRVGVALVVMNLVAAKLVTVVMAERPLYSARKFLQIGT